MSKNDDGHMATIKGLPALMSLAAHLINGGSSASSSWDGINYSILEAAVETGLLVQDRSRYKPSKRGWKLVAKLLKVPTIHPHKYHEVFEKAGEM